MRAPTRLSRAPLGLLLAPTVLALLALPSRPAQAREVWESGELSLELDGFYKTYGAFLRLPSGLVEGTDALSRLMEEARATLPPEDAGALPAVAPLPEEAALNTQVLRASARFFWGRRLDAEVAWELGALLASDPAFSGGAPLGGTPVGPGATARRRLVDFDGVLAETDTFRLTHDLDRLSVHLAVPGADVVAGRQVLGWGTGRLWNPTDLLSPFSPTDLDTEVRRGVDALRVSIPLGLTGFLDLLWLPQERLEDQGGVVRAQANVFETDVSLSVAKYVSDLVVGADVAGDLGDLGVYAEAAYTFGFQGWEDGPTTLEEHFLRAVGGVQWRPHERLLLLGEYYFNGFGTAAPEDYLAKLSSDRVLRGEIFGAGRHYLGVVPTWLASDLVTVSTTVLVNLQDPSALLFPTVEWSVEQSVILRAGAFLPVGPRPDSSVFEGLGPTDLLQGTPAFRAAEGMGLQSEYGASAAGVLVQLAVYR